TRGTEIEPALPPRRHRHLPDVTRGVTPSGCVGLQGDRRPAATRVDHADRALRLGRGPAHRERPGGRSHRARQRGGRPRAPAPVPAAGGPHHASPPTTPDDGRVARTSTPTGEPEPANAATSNTPTERPPTGTACGRAVDWSSKRGVISTSVAAVSKFATSTTW